MSDNWIIVIPEEPDFVPDSAAQEEAIALFRTIAPRADEIVSQVTDKIRFIDCGANLRGIICPVCGADIAIDWWQDRMDEEYEADYPLRPVELPCCRTMRPLGDLKFDWPQGFARFSIEAMNPDIGDLEPDQVMAFERLLGCKVRKVLQHL